MESIKACLPDMIRSRIEDLIDAQTVDEEMAARMNELGSLMAELRELAGGQENERLRQLAEDIPQLCDRIRRDYVAMAYRQGLVDGVRVKQTVSVEIE
uniref:Uncharacterized protein n=1 Tax=Desulfovibrio sp. U5L TaxID=596152 RepID=I2Q1A3_9BACT